MVSSDAKLFESEAKSFEQKEKKDQWKKVEVRMKNERDETENDVSVLLKFKNFIDVEITINWRKAKTKWLTVSQ